MTAPPRVLRTLSTDLFEQLRADILHCRLDPGARLRFKELRQRYKSGLSPLREALMRLVAEGLVVLTDHKGFTVAPVTREEMIDIARTLFELEALAIRLAIEKGDDHWEATVVARCHELSKRSVFTEGGELDVEWEARNVAFHKSLYAACGSPSLIELTRQLSERFSRYRKLWAREADGTRDVAREHEEIMKATIGRDAARAVALLRHHRETTIDDIVMNWDRSLAAAAPPPRSRAARAAGRRRPRAVGRSRRARASATSSRARPR
ncbi:MAG: FCD domain-containing protein [Luteitalea sp.]|nr:FCD domain-containing protein [Luteitalea sp.]